MVTEENFKIIIKSRKQKGKFLEIGISIDPRSRNIVKIAMMSPKPVIFSTFLYEIDVKYISKLVNSKAKILRQ